MAGATTVAKAKQASAVSVSVPTPQTESALQTVEVRRETTTTRGVAVSVNSTTVQKRKREGSDQQGAAGGAGEGARRGGNKRVATSTNGAVVPASTGAAAKGTEVTEPAETPTVSDATDSAPVEAGNADENEAMNQTSTEALDFASLPQGQNGSNADQPANGANQPDATSTAVAALAGIFPTMTVPQPTDISFANSSGTDNERNLDPSFNEGASLQAGGNDSDDSPRGGVGRQLSSGGESGQPRKPTVGSDEWHRIRRDNHKEVERRRRETINEGINELAKIVPGCEKNKGSILQRAVAFITQLKDNERENIEKWTLEKLVTEQAIAELSANNEKLKLECERAWRETEVYKKACQNAGIAPGKEDVKATQEAES